MQHILPKIHLLLFESVTSPRKRMEYFNQVRFVNLRVIVIPLQAWLCPWGSRRLGLPEFLDSRNMKVVRLSALGTGRLYPPPPGDNAGTHFRHRLS